MDIALQKKKRIDEFKSKMMLDRIKAKFPDDSVEVKTSNFGAYHLIVKRSYMVAEDKVVLKHRLKADTELLAIEEAYHMSRSMKLIKRADKGYRHMIGIC